LPACGKPKQIGARLFLMVVGNPMAVQTKEHVLELIRDHQAYIRALGVKRLGVFGSFVHGQQGVDSDVGVLVEFQVGRKTFDHFIRLAFFLEALFDRRVELVTPESLSPYLGPQILNEVKYVTFDTGLPTAHPR
jgi:predicted nucleotidyltransferase